MDDTDEEAKRFDNLMYGMMIAQIERMPQLKKGKKQLIKLCQALSERATIPQIKEKLVIINTIYTDEFWESSGILDFERVRMELRSLIQFIVEKGVKNTSSLSSKKRNLSR